jgi:hypothetical protein
MMMRFAILALALVTLTVATTEEVVDESKLHGEHWLKYQKDNIEAKFAAEHPDRLDVAKDDILVNLSAKKDENDAPESWDLPDIKPKVQKLDKNGLPVLSMDDLSFVQESVEEDFDDGAVHGHNFLMQQKKAVEAKFRAEHPEEIDVADDDMLVNIAEKKGKFSDDADTPESWDLPDIKPKVQKLDKNGLPELSMDDLSFVQAQQVVQEPSLYQEQVKLFDHVQKLDETSFKPLYDQQTLLFQEQTKSVEEIVPETEMIQFPAWVNTEADIEKFLASQKGPVIRKTGHTATKSELTQIASEVDGNLMKDCTGAEKEMCLFCQRAHRKIRRDPKYFVNGKRTGEELPDMPSECDKEELYLVAPPTIAMIQEHTMAPETEFMTFPSWVETEADIEKYLSTQKTTVVHKSQGHQATKEELTQMTSELSGRLFKDCKGTMKHMCLMCQSEYRKIRRNPKYFKDGVQKVKVLPEMPVGCEDESEYLA